MDTIRVIRRAPYPKDEPIVRGTGGIYIKNPDYTGRKRQKETKASRLLKLARDLKGTFGDLKFDGPEETGCWS